jgi:hypothetical protein
MAGHSPNERPGRGDNEAQHGDPGLPVAQRRGRVCLQWNASPWIARQRTPERRLAVRLCVDALACGLSAVAGTLADVQLHMGVNGLDFGCRIRRSGPRMAGMTSKTMPGKPTSADSNQRAFALAA